MDTLSVDLSVIIVNYNVSGLVLEAVASLRSQKFTTPEGNAGRLEILVIDNASSSADAAYLERLPSDVVLVRNDVNVGFAGANNQGIARASGRYLCFLNPDTKVLDGALDALLRYLYSHPEVGAVGPRIWADQERTLLLPPGDPPTFTFLMGRLIADLLPAWGGALNGRWHRYAMTVWRSREPIEVPMLSGACILTPRTVIDRVGGFDPRYFLYYEDADWCRRVRRTGYRLVQVPNAAIVHYFNQSAKQDVWGTQGHACRSQARFVEIHYGLSGRMLYVALRALRARLTHGAIPLPPEVTDFGVLADPPTWRLPEARSERERVVEIGFDLPLIPSAAAFVHGAEYRLSSEIWKRLQPGRYFARLVPPDTLRALGIWSWIKE